MHKLRRLATLATIVLAVVIYGCNDKKRKEAAREKPTCIVKVIGRGALGLEAGMNGSIKPNDWDPVLTVSGPGSFISAVVSTKGGNPNDTTTVSLTLDDQEVSMKSFKLARIMGLSEQNYSGIVWLKGEGDIETLVLGYPQQLYFKERLMLSVKVNDDSVKKVFLYATYTKEHLGDNEKGSGGGGEPPFP